MKYMCRLLPAGQSLELREECCQIERRRGGGDKEQCELYSSGSRRSARIISVPLWEQLQRRLHRRLRSATNLSELFVSAPARRCVHCPLSERARRARLDQHHFAIDIFPTYLTSPCCLLASQTANSLLDRIPLRLDSS